MFKFPQLSYKHFFLASLNQDSNKLYTWQLIVSSLLLICRFPFHLPHLVICLLKKLGCLSFRAEILK